MTRTQSAWRPEHAIEIVAGTPPGGGLDRTARALAQSIESQKLAGVPVKVINMPGDGSRRVWAYLDRFPNDPHVLVVSSPNVTTDNLTGHTAYDHGSYTPLAILHNEYLAFVVRADSPLADAARLRARLAADAGSLKVALATSLGNPSHIALARVVRHLRGDVRALNVHAFDSARHAVASVVAGGCDIGAVSAASAVTELLDGTLRALAVSAPARLAGPYAQTPTWAEQGIDCVAGIWRGVNGARGLGAEQIRFWDSVLAAATAGDEWKSTLTQYHWSEMYRNSAELRDYLPRERAEMSTMLAELGLPG